jgi:hypothetical protein
MKQKKTETAQQLLATDTEPTHTDEDMPQVTADAYC